MRARLLSGLLSVGILVMASPAQPAWASKPSPAAQSPRENVDVRGGLPGQRGDDRRVSFSQVRNDERGDDGRGRHDDRGHDRDNDRHDWRDDRDHRDHWRDDDRRDWDRDWRGHDRDRYDLYRHTTHVHRHYYYPRHGHVIYRLPHRHRVVYHYGTPYYFGDGFWYRPYGPAFMIVAPPIGLIISFLPEAHTTLWIGGIPYYAANDVYYRWKPEHRAYVVTELPRGYD